MKEVTSLPRGAGAVQSQKHANLYTDDCIWKRNFHAVCILPIREHVITGESHSQVENKQPNEGWHASTAKTYPTSETYPTGETAPMVNVSEISHAG